MIKKLRNWRYDPIAYPEVLKEVADRRIKTILDHSGFDIQKYDGQLRRLKLGLKAGSWQTIELDGEYVNDRNKFINNFLLEPVKTGYYADIHGNIYCVCITKDEEELTLEGYVPLATGSTLLGQETVMIRKVEPEMISEITPHRDGLGLPLSSVATVFLPYGELTARRKVCDIMVECWFDEFVKMLGSDRLPTKLEPEIWRHSRARSIHGYRDGDAKNNSILNIMLCQERAGFWSDADVRRWLEKRGDTPRITWGGDIMSSSKICEQEGWLKLNASLGELEALSLGVPENGLTFSDLKITTSVDINAKICLYNQSHPRRRF